MPSLHRRCAAALLLAAPAAARAQDCPGLPEVPPPEVENCRGGGFMSRLKGETGGACDRRNQQRAAAHERLTRGFDLGVHYDTRQGAAKHLAESPDAATEDRLLGCRGRTVSLAVLPGNTDALAYRLTSPSGVTVAEGRHRAGGAGRIDGPTFTLPETGAYVLTVATRAAPVRQEVVVLVGEQPRRNADGSMYVLRYPRTYGITFATERVRAAAAAGSSQDGAATSAQPFVRQVPVRANSKVRFRIASMGTGDFTYRVLRPSGEEVQRAERPTAFVETPAVTPADDESWRVEVRPAAPGGVVGVQFTLVEDARGAAPLVVPARVESAFRLPPRFDSEASPEHRGVAAARTSQLSYRSQGPERLTLTVRPSTVAGLRVRVRVYDRDTEEVVVDRGVAQATAIPVTLPRRGLWTIALSPVSAVDLADEGDARYTLELAPAAAGRRAAGRP